MKHIFNLRFWTFGGWFTWVAVAVGVGGAVVGGVASYAGASKQADANTNANNANLAQQQAQNDAAWRNYLLTRGINAQGATSGNLPDNAPAVNSRLPLWANVTRTPAGGTSSKWVKKGTAPSAPTYALMSSMGGGNPTVSSYGNGTAGGPAGNPMGAGGGSAPSGGGYALNPLFNMREAIGAPTPNPAMPDPGMPDWWKLSGKVG